MVAAHAYDLRAAAQVYVEFFDLLVVLLKRRYSGMKTAYIRRETEDPDEDMAQIRAETDYFFDIATSAAGAADYGLSALADMLGC